MTDMITIPSEELARLKERIRKLSRNKSHLQLVNSLMNKVSAAQGLDHMITTLLSNILDVIGGVNIILYFMIDNDLFSADVYGKQIKLDHIEDEQVKKAFEFRVPIEYESDFNATRMLTPEFTKAYTWVFPLLAGSELIGVIKLENLQISMRELYCRQPAFFTYVATVLKNEIHSQTRLKKAQDQLRELNEKLERESAERKQVAEDILHSGDALAHLKERIRKLAQDKSYHQLIINLINKVSAAQGLENMIETLLNNILDVLGGANIILYYRIDEDLYYADLFGKRMKLDCIEDELVRKALESGKPVEDEHAFSDTQMLTPEFSKAYTWVFPLLAGSEQIGVIKLESLHIGMRELYGTLPTFFNYVASVMKNEIQSQSRLKQAYDKLSDTYDDLKRVQSQLLQQDKMASIGQLAAGVAHEINNPMGFIISNLGTLSRYVEKLNAYLLSNEKLSAGGDPAMLELMMQERKKYKVDLIRKDLPELIAESQEGAERVRRIVQDLKSFSRVDSSSGAYNDIHEGLESTISIAWNELKYKAAVIREYGRLPQVWCNMGQLNQVFLNLLVNAAHAIAEQGEIRITTALEGNSVRIAIRDSGSGIPPENIKHIFDPFFTTKEVGKGTGLGLAIAYDIVVNKHGGKIEVQSEPDRGSTFTITLPVERESEAQNTEVKQ